MKEKTLAKRIGCSVDEALRTMEKYMSRYPAVTHFYKEAIEETRRTGYAFSIMGRRRFLPEIASYSEYDRFKAERRAVNMQIQASAADVARMAMINISEARLDLLYNCKMFLQVHDELLFECPRETAPQAILEIQAWMEHPFPTDLEVPLSISIGSADCWGDAK